MRILSFLMICLLCTSTMAQDPEYINDACNPDLLIIADRVMDNGFIYYKDEIPLPPATFFEDHGVAFGLTHDDEMVLIETTADNFGWVHHKYKQYYLGLPVSNGLHVLHSYNNQVIMSNGNIEALSAVTGIPILPEQLALTEALEEINATVYLWEDLNEEMLLQQRTGDPLATYYPYGELAWIVHKETGVDSAYAILSWIFQIGSTVPPTRKTIGIDANSGEVIINDDMAVFSSEPATAKTIYSGNQQITIEFDGATQYSLEDLPRGILTLDHSSGTSVPIIHNSTIWDDVTFYSNDVDGSPLDAHWAAEQFYDYLLTVHGRLSFDGLGGQMINRTKVVAGGFPIVAVVPPCNALFDPGTYTAYFGEGDPSINCLPFTSLDIIGHEWGHGVNYSEGIQSGFYLGSVQEGLADMFGVFLENYVDPNLVNWTTFEHSLDPLSDHIRYIDNPIQSDNPDCYSEVIIPGTTECFGWPDGTYNPGEPHYYSTVISHAYYLLINGEAGINSSGRNYSVSGLGIEMVQDLFYLILEGGYMSGCLASAFPETTVYNAFHCVKDATLNAAIQLWGECSHEVRQVINAFYAVNLIRELPDDLMFEAIVELCGTYNDPLNATFIEVFNTAAVSPSTCSNPFVVEPNVHVEVNAGHVIEMSPGFHAKAGSNYRAYIDYCIDFNSYDSRFVYAIAQGEGLGSHLNYKQIKLFPNPGNSIVKIEGIVDNILNVNIYNTLGRECKAYYNKKESSIDVSNLEEGFYTVLVFTAWNQYSSQLIIVH